MTPEPPEQLVAILLRVRAKGYGFSVAWRQAMRGIDWGSRDRTTRHDWRAAFRAMEGELRAAYEGEPTPAGEAAMALHAAISATNAGEDAPLQLIA